jgi:hypothetical protein
MLYVAGFRDLLGASSTSVAILSFFLGGATILRRILNLVRRLGSSFFSNIAEVYTSPTSPGFSLVTFVGRGHGL